MIDKTYQPSAVERRIYAMWEDAGAFRAGRPERRAANPYCIVIPPPNVTGSLHMGHALNNTLQDVLARFERMRGRDVLWQPGTDHAGIATQMVVERQLMERQEHRRMLGREKFVERVWAWKAESGGTIINQLKRLGASCDWSRERFTMDEGLSRAVLKVFVELYRDGLIYKDKRLVNWDPRFGTAISDLEVQQVEVKGHLWHIRYPLEGAAFDPSDPATFITVATTRPETMLGDVAVAVHPDDERYRHLIGRYAVLPLVGRRIPIVADEYSDPEKGTGAVKITPAHDFNDFEVGRRHDLPVVNVFNAEAKLDLADNEAFLEGLPRSAELVQTLTYHGRDRFEVRKDIVRRLEEMGLLAKIEPHTHTVPHGDRSGVVIEPFLTDQWYVNAKALAVRAIEAVREGRTVFVPKSWEKTYFDWMENIQPWCISRQLWWGHQIPAWYGPDGKVFVAEREDEAVSRALAYYQETSAITSEQAREMALQPEKRAPFLIRDEDVLDTWFSSALWPFSTLGWPDEAPELKRYYPTDALVTGFDIIFFWVARMMMMGLHFMKEVPFHTVYVHALVRDERGAKMSKSKGNVIDPLGLIDEYGADALRFTLAAMAAQGRDIKLSTQRVEGYRNFATKLWNACRFAEMNRCVTVPDFDPAFAQQTLNRWIAHETGKAVREVTEAIEAYKFNEAAGAAYRFVWNIFCDWYLELAKPLLQGEDGAAKDETRAMTAWVRDGILKLLHPFMPFVTEELWQVTAEGGPARTSLLALAPWPADTDFEDFEAEGEIGWIIDLVTAVRSLRAEMNIAPGSEIPLVLVGVSTATQARADRWVEFIRRLARLSGISVTESVPPGAVQFIVRGEVAALPLQGVIDFAAEKARLEKEMARAKSDIARIDAKLANADFIARAPEDVVEGEREKREEAETRRRKIEEALERLKRADLQVGVASRPAQAESRASRNFAIYVLGAGFSCPAGLPLANELWSEVRRRAERMEGRAAKDLDYYIAYRKTCDGVELTRDTVNFEEFLGFLDVEFHLGLRGSDTWSTDGNEAQVVVKTLIGEILTERMPVKVPELYLQFAKKLQPNDLVLTFNYDVLLERALSQVGTPYRLFPTRYESVGPNGGGVVDNSRKEVVIFKLHGSIDWFDRRRYRRREEEFRRQGVAGHPNDPVFHPSSGLGMAPLLDGPHEDEDPLGEVFRVLDIEKLYARRPLFLATPLIVPPSVTKVLWFEPFKDFWWGMDAAGGLNLRMAIIGFSLAAHDDYARQAIYTMVRNYQHVEWGNEILGKKKSPLLLCDLQESEDAKTKFRRRYAFVDWAKAETEFEGFNEKVIAKL
jgi:valyl-tRNA synthetase